MSPLWSKGHGGVPPLAKYIHRHNDAAISVTLVSVYVVGQWSGSSPNHFIFCASVAKFLVLEWGIKLTPAQGCRSGLPAIAAKQAKNLFYYTGTTSPTNQPRKVPFLLCPHLPQFKPLLQIRDVYTGSWFFTHPGSKNQKERGERKVVIPFSVATNFTNLKIILFWNAEEKNLAPKIFHQI